MQPEADEERWDFYFGRVDDAPASIWLDLALLEATPIAGLDTLFAVAVAMLAPGDHGVGEQSEADAMWSAEDRIVADAAEIGLRYIGRLRNQGVWQLTFMGPPGAEADLDRIAHHALASPDGETRTHQILSQPDPEWTYYREFLFPTLEREQWIADRHVVEQLAREGDSLATPREVKHWMYFETEADRDGFATAVAAEGFACECPAADEEGRFVAVAARHDPVRLESIHAVVMKVIECGDAWRGDYDGWESSIESQPG